MKRILSLLLSAMLLLSISFTTFAESNVITTNIQTLEKSDEKCVVKETRTDSIIISTNDKVNNTLTIETYDISDKRKLNTQTYFLNVLEKNIELNNKIGKGQILRSTPNTAPLICGACNTQPEGLSTMA